MKKGGVARSQYGELNVQALSEDTAIARALVARISDEGFKYLDAPIKRVASKAAPIAYASVLENELHVQTNWIEQALYETIKI